MIPLRAKYFHSNFRVEGLEARCLVEKHDRPDTSGDPNLQDYEKMIPDITPEEWNLPSTLVTDREIRFKFAIDGRVLSVDANWDGHMAHCQLATRRNPTLALEEVLRNRESYL